MNCTIAFSAAERQDVELHCGSRISDAHHSFCHHNNDNSAAMTADAADCNSVVGGCTAADRSSAVGGCIAADRNSAVSGCTVADRNSADGHCIAVV